jgi:hypothetical protein
MIYHIICEWIKIVYTDKVHWFCKYTILLMHTKPTHHKCGIKVRIPPLFHLILPAGTTLHPQLSQT